MDPRSSALGSNRRAPIPRPWLSEHHYVRPLHLHPDYRYAPPMMGGPPYQGMPDSMDILQKQDWKVSWGKLSCCFCLRGGPQSPSQKNSSENGGGRRHHHDHVPFPAFPILRRNSSSSLLVNENDVYPSSGFVSSFTESDTSQSESEIVVVRTTTFDSEELRRVSPPRPSTPPPAPVTSKPHIIANRSRSAGLPPPVKNNHPNCNSSFGTPQPPARGRFDTGNYTSYSGTSNASRHRREQQFEFSTGSIKEIWQGNPVDENLVLPSYVLCQDANTSRPNDSGYISALEDSEDWGNNSDSYYDGDNDEDFMEGIASNSRYSQIQQPKIATADTGRRRRTDDRPPSARRSRRNNKEGQKAQRPPAKKPSDNAADPTVVPVYMRKNSRLDIATNDNLVVSGWVAFSLGSTLAERLQFESKRIEAKNILYLRIVDDVSGGARILLHSSNGNIVHELHLQRDWICESREISSRIGRCVNIRSRSSPRTSIASLLPVSLDDAFFRGDELVSQQQFGPLHDRMFVAGKGKVYAPDEQHDAAMYMMFSLDALIKNCL